MLGMSIASRGFHVSSSVIVFRDKFITKLNYVVKLIWPHRDSPLCPNSGNTLISFKKHMHTAWMFKGDVMLQVDLN